MNIKSLLLGSAAALVAVSGARAADAVVIIPEPEPVEYVRVCDVYGAGFYYIPGTETCLKIGGQVRYEMKYYPGSAAVTGGPGFDRLATEAGLTKYSRFLVTFDARSETELGTLQTFAEVMMEWQPGWTVATPTTQTWGYGTSITSEHVYIELAGIRLGRSNTPFARFLGYGGYTMSGGNYGYANSSELSYTFSSGAFSGIVALVEDTDDSNWVPNVEAGAKFVQGWGSVGLIAGYDENTSTFGIKGGVEVTPDGLPVTAKLHVFYSNGAGGSYSLTDGPSGGGAWAQWSVLGSASVAFSPKLGVEATAQWFNTGNWFFAGGASFKPFESGRLVIRPEVTYYSQSAAPWGGRIRFDSNF